MAEKPITTLADISGEILVTPCAPGAGKTPTHRKSVVFTTASGVIVLPGARIRTRPPIALTRRQQRRIAALIERLIRLLDATEYDADREPEPIEDDEREDSAQAPVTPDSTRPVPMIWWGAQA